MASGETIVVRPTQSAPSSAWPIAGSQSQSRITARIADRAGGDAAPRAAPPKPAADRPAVARRQSESLAVGRRRGDAANGVQRSSFLQRGNSSHNVNMTRSHHGGYRANNGKRSSFFQRRNSSHEFMMGNHSHHGGHSEGAGVFFPFRQRKSLDYQMSLLQGKGDLDSSTASDNASVLYYQEVFQQMKSENPTSTLGALQQKTMTRIVELKTQKQAKEQELRDEFLRQEEEERVRNQTLAQKYVDKWVEKLRHHNQEQHKERPNASRPAPRRGEFLYSVHNGLLPEPDRCASLLEPRRFSVESGYTHGSTSTGPSVDEPMQVHAERITAGSRGDGRGSNIAPRRSVGDLTEHERELWGGGFAAEESSRKSGGSEVLSDVSGVFIDRDSVATRITARSRSPGLIRLSELKGIAVSGTKDRDDDDDDEVDSGLDRDSLGGWEHKLQEMLTARSKLSFDDDDFARPAATDLNNDEEEDDDRPWEVRSDGLIVGFVDRSAYVYPREDEDELIVGFVDRSDGTNHSDHSCPGEADEAAGLGNTARGDRRGEGPPRSFATAKPSPYAPVAEEPKPCRGWFRWKNSLPDALWDSSSSVY